MHNCLFPLYHLFRAPDVINLFTVCQFINFYAKAKEKVNQKVATKNVTELWNYGKHLQLQ